MAAAARPAHLAASPSSETSGSSCQDWWARYCERFLHVKVQGQSQHTLYSLGLPPAGGWYLPHRQQLEAFVCYRPRPCTVAPWQQPFVTSSLDHFLHLCRLFCCAGRGVPRRALRPHRDWHRIRYPLKPYCALHISASRSRDPCWCWLTRRCRHVSSELKHKHVRATCPTPLREGTSCPPRVRHHFEKVPAARVHIVLCTTSPAYKAQKSYVVLHIFLLPPRLKTQT